MTHFLDIGKKMKERRSLLRITQQDLAEVLECGQSKIWKPIKEIRLLKPSLKSLMLWGWRWNYELKIKN